MEKRTRHGFGLVRSTGGAGLPEVQYRVRFEVRGAGCYPIDYFDQVSPADDYRIKGIKHHMRQGTGSPLAALRENRHQSSVENHYPDEAITRAVTAVIERGPVKSGVQDVNIRLLCPLRNDTVTLAGQARPLAADFSVPWAMLLSRAGDLKRSGVVDAVLTRRPKRKPQLYLMEPYDPDKEPLIMIHGLYSTPLAFAELSNDLWSVDAIRRRYQIWHYLYNTSAPPLYPARILRSQSPRNPQPARSRRKRPGHAENHPSDPQHGRDHRQGARH